MIPYAIALVVLWLAGNIAYIVGTFPVRSVGIPVVIGSTVAFLALGTCVLLPIVLLMTERPAGRSG